MKVAIFTFGCKVNQYESQWIAEQLTRTGFEQVSPDEKADIYIINTCTVTAEADRQARQIIRRIYRDQPLARIIVTGCYAQRSPSEIRALNPNLLVLANGAKSNIINYLSPSIINHQSSIINRFSGHTRAFIKVQDGCDNFCAYCIVPYVRPKIYSRNFHQILKEIETLVNNGYQEIVLTGIRLGRYQGFLETSQESDPKGFSAIYRRKGFSLADSHRSGVMGLGQLVEAIHQIDGLNRIRLSSIEPLDMAKELIECTAVLPKVCPHLHIPLESGDDEILKKMHRGYTRATYQHIIQLIRTHIPDIAITTDVMAGFPGEKEENFDTTYDFIKTIGFSKLHVFRFSTRPGTLAYSLPGRVSPETIKIRVKKLLALSSQLTEKFAKQFIGKIEEVLVENRRDPATNLLSGLTPHYLRAWFEGSDKLKNNIVKIKITGVAKGKLKGKILTIPR